jgi:uncharacterized protein involved in exopolysaccharide biosynthesis
MAEHPDAPPSSRGSSGVEPGSLASFLHFLWRHRRLIGGVTGIATALAILVVLVVPVEYTAKATLLPEQQSRSGLLSLMASMSGGGLGSLSRLAGLTGGSNIEEAIVGSERMADAIAEELGFQERYRFRNRESRLRAWHNRLKAKTNRQGLLTISYRDRDPEFAVEVVAAVIANLDRLNRSFRITVGRRTREFIEVRIEEAKERLEEVENKLVTLQEGNQSLALSPTSEAVVEAGAGVLAQRMRLEMEMEVLKEHLDPSAPALRSKQAEIRALDKELARLPEISLELARLMRELKFREQAYAYLIAQLEEARIEEARDTPTVDVLDPPVLPEMKTYPQRTLTVLAVFFLAGCLSLGAAKFLDAVIELRGRGSGIG